MDTESVSHDSCKQTGLLRRAMKSVMTDVPQTFCVSQCVYLRVQSTYVLRDGVSGKKNPRFFLITYAFVTKVIGVLREDGLLRNALLYLTLSLLPVHHNTLLSLTLSLLPVHNTLLSLALSLLPVHHNTLLSLAVSFACTPQHTSVSC